MKPGLILFLLLFGCEALFAQKDVTNYRRMLEARSQIQGVAYDIQVADGRLSVERQQLLLPKRRYLKKVGRDIEMAGLILDGNQVIDYHTDTVYMLTTLYLPTGTSSLTIKTRKGAFQFIKSEDDYILKSLNEYLESFPADLRSSESLFYETAFCWDMQPLIHLIEHSGAISDPDYVMSLNRIVLHDNQVVYKDVIRFPPALRWHF